MEPIRLQGIVKKFGQTTAVDHVDLDIPGGSLFFLLGPSGCGKTTLLRMIAGFTEPNAGKIFFGERDVTRVAPQKRNAGMVFQGYALWPHMTVAQNVAFGLTVRKIDKQQRQQRVEKALERVQMLQYADRKPNQLSGGQQQRVALARALVIEPTVLLLDEPLSNLDAKLRLDMRQQIREICHQAKITAVYVTHDQKEALSMADGIAVLNNGRVVQTGPPRELYLRPRNRFVADFLGETNFVSAQVMGEEDGFLLLDSPAGRLKSTVFPDHLPKSGNVTCSIRPEAIRIGSVNGVSQSNAGMNMWRGSREHLVYLGETAQHRVRVADDTQLKVFELNPSLHEPESPAVEVRFSASDVVVLQD